MSFIRKNYLLIAVCVLIVAALVGCSKNDKGYYNYSNTAGTFKGSTYEYLTAQTGVYDSLLFVAGRLTGLSAALKTGNITLFAANNRSFELALFNINQARKDSIPAMPQVSLATIDSALLDTFVCRYIIPGLQHTDSLKGFTDGKLYASFRYDYNMQLQYVATNASGFLGGGPKTITFSDPRNSIFTRNWVRVNTITVDIKTTNGIVHLLPTGHDFGFGNDFIKRVNKR
ncbi:hypothetical protein ESA94_06035 [Lacibacter luteus]|uniref:FAS1 domain-containing protein n=1 Tax=Lacibacter luteus TaxID=2508719 RepID=A0A4Q1CNA4_9BACT|nr:fasciclin domain-containing protein [Lacibacter luteus]RXK62556.1 hypothetical protein ESA94_06035 [Lacibacter luteus]